jgi:hypothetical protein
MKSIMVSITTDPDFMIVELSNKNYLVRDIARWNPKKGFPYKQLFRALTKLYWSKTCQNLNRVISPILKTSLFRSFSHPVSITGSLSTITKPVLYVPESLYKKSLLNIFPGYVRIVKVKEQKFCRDNGRGQHLKPLQKEAESHAGNESLNPAR